MDEAVTPSFQHPLLVKKGAAFTCIVVANTTALDGITHQVMFIGTGSHLPYSLHNLLRFIRFIINGLQCIHPGQHFYEFLTWAFTNQMCVCVFVTASGSVLKAVNYNKEPVIIEEVQLFKPSEPVKILRLSVSRVKQRFISFFHPDFRNIRNVHLKHISRFIIYLFIYSYIFFVLDVFRWSWIEGCY